MTIPALGTRRKLRLRNVDGPRLHDLWPRAVMRARAPRLGLRPFELGRHTALSDTRSLHLRLRRSEGLRALRVKSRAQIHLTKPAGDAIALANKLGWIRFSLIGHSMSG